MVPRRRSNAWVVAAKGQWLLFSDKIETASATWLEYGTGLRRRGSFIVEPQEFTENQTI